MGINQHSTVECIHSTYYYSLDVVDQTEPKVDSSHPRELLLITFLKFMSAMKIIDSLKTRNQRGAMTVHFNIKAEQQLDQVSSGSGAALKRNL